MELATKPSISGLNALTIYRWGGEGRGMWCWEGRETDCNGVQTEQDTLRRNFDSHHWFLRSAINYIPNQPICQ